MADLRGAIISPGGELPIGSQYPSLPMFTEDDASPIGRYRWFYLTGLDLQDDKKELVVRPTGPNGSGPYFHAIKSGMYGVRRANVVRPNAWPSGDPYYAAVTKCNYVYDQISSDPWYGPVRHVVKAYCNGKTVIYYEISVNEPGHLYRAAFAGITGISIAGNKSFPRNTRADRWRWGPYRNFTLSSCDFIKQKLDYFAWSILSGAETGHVDPELVHDSCTLSAAAGKPLVLSDGELEYQHGELNAFEWWSITDTMEGKYRALAGQAFYNAATNLPKSTSNSIANVLEAASTVHSLIKGDVTKLLPTNPKDAWLFYRYQYSTTKLDIADYRSLTERLMAVASLPVLRSDGVASGNGITCHCMIDVDPSYIIPQNTKDWLKAYGFQLSWYNAWDMIPFSFVVDWFASIGNFLEVMENENWMYNLPILNAWTSFSTYGPSAQSTYFRVPGYFRANAPFLDYKQRGASGKTIVKRVLDSIALFT